MVQYKLEILIIFFLSLSHQILMMPSTDCIKNNNCDTFSLDFREKNVSKLDSISALSFLSSFSNTTNNKCIKEIKQFLSDHATNQDWALRMYDSSSKCMKEDFNIDTYYMGNFDECIQIKRETEFIKTKFCLAKIIQNDMDKNFSRLNQSNGTYWAICLPAVCTAEEAKEAINHIMNSFSTKSYTVDITENYCYSSTNDHSFTKSQIIFGTVITLFLAWTIFCTSYHLNTLVKAKKTEFSLVDDKKLNFCKELILCFSLINNVQSFLQTNSTDQNLECICGIKFISMLFIISGHALVFIFGGIILNKQFIAEEVINPMNAFFLNNPLLVDTFLLLSGFLMGYIFLEELRKRNGKINFLILYIARYIRLTPSYFFVIALYCTFLIEMGSGPLWNMRIGLERDRCWNSWWINLLYINNYVNTDQLCMFQSWYLAVDYHLFIIAPFLLYLFWKYHIWGYITLGIFLIISTLIPFGITFADNLDPTLMIYPLEISDLSKNNYFANYYIKTHMRASSYFLGLLLACGISNFQQNAKKISNKLLAVGWITSTIAGFTAMNLVTIFYLPDLHVDILLTAVYSALHRIVWAAAIGWVIFVCVTDNSDYVRKFLSWKIFIPLSRLTYCAYLMNGLVEITFAASVRQPLFINRYELVSRVLSHIIFTLSGAFVLCILLESPIHGVEKIILKREKKEEPTGNRVRSLVENATQ